jgi:hypothetical protein
VVVQASLVEMDVDIPEWQRDLLKLEFPVSATEKDSRDFWTHFQVSCL